MFKTSLLEQLKGLLKMPEELVFENVWAATVGYSKSSTIRLSEDDLQHVDTSDYSINIILTPKPTKLVEGWYMEPDDFEEPIDSCGYGRSAEMIYYTQMELDNGERPDLDGLILVNVARPAAL
jgi:hypothetical protein